MLKEFLQDSSHKNIALKNVYSLIHQNGPISRAELQEKTQLNKSTLARFIDELLKNKFIRESGIGESSGGRPPVLYYIEPGCAYTIGVVITRLNTIVGLYDLLFEPVDQDSFVITSKDTPDVSISKIKHIVQHFMNKHQITTDQLLGIGIGVSGPLDREKGLITEVEPILAPGWVNVPIVEMLKKSFPVTIHIENSANTTVLGEYKYVSAFQNVLCFRSGGGIGCGIITNGMLDRGTADDTTRYAHIVLDPNGRKCTCGKRGCLVSYTSPYSIIDELVNQDSSIDWMAKDLKNKPIDDLIAFLKEEYSLTKDIVMESARYFGIAVANMINILHSDLVILVAPLIREYPEFYEEVIDSAMQNLYPKENVKFTQGQLNENAAAVGAATLIFDSYFIT